MIIVLVCACVCVCLRRYWVCVASEVTIVYHYYCQDLGSHLPILFIGRRGMPGTRLFVFTKSSGDGPEKQYMNSILSTDYKYEVNRNGLS